LAGNECADTDVYSIREFCDLEMPIIMFDKDGAFVVMRLEQVRGYAWRSLGFVFTDVCLATAIVLRS
jgi:hypothetical protein